jgi:hypothetical protein
LAQQLAACIATGRDFLGAKVEQQPVLGLFSEDGDDELVRRQWRLNRALGLRNRDLTGLHIQGRAGLTNTLASFPLGAPRVEALFDAVTRKAREINAKLVILDNRAQMLLVAENDRAQATFAANLCAGIAREIDGAVLLLGHTAKPKDSEYSGSTAWDAVTRSRWLLRRADEVDGPPELILERVKSNYAGADIVRLAWADGVLRVRDEAHMTYGDRLAAEQRRGAARQAFLDALDQLTTQGRNVSHSPQARQSYAPRLMRDAGLVDGFTIKELEEAMNSLFADQRIEANAVVGRNSRRQPTHGIARSSVA